MENLTKFDDLDGKLDEKSMILSRCYLTRALETIWDVFFADFGPFKGEAFLLELVAERPKPDCGAGARFF